MTGPGPVGILGLGLIGGSLAAALTRAGQPCWGWDPDSRSRSTARRRGWITEAPRDWRERSREHPVILAAPLDANQALLEELPREAVLVTDVGSVKRPIAAAGKRRFQDRFVPGHPMAGREHSGIGHADPDLFVDAPWILCGGGEAPRRRVAALVRKVGARPRTMTPVAHDRVVAAVSHLPQLLASLWVGDLSRRRPEALEIAGPGFRNWGRLAGSDPELWREILTANAPLVKKELARLESRLADLRSRWEIEDNAPLRELTRGQRGYRVWRRKKMRSG